MVLKKLDTGSLKLLLPWDCSEIFLPLFIIRLYLVIVLIPYPIFFNKKISSIDLSTSIKEKLNHCTDCFTKPF